MVSTAILLAVCILPAFEPDGEHEKRRMLRWEVLVVDERELIESIREHLKSGAGELSPDDFEFVYGTKNEILVDKELIAGAKISCGPFVDSLAKKLSLGPEQRLALLAKFHASLGPTERKGHQLLQRRPASSAMPGMRELVKLDRLATVMKDRERPLTDDEIKFLRDSPFAEASLRKYLKMKP